MATLNVINMEGAEVGQIELSDAVFNAPVKEHLLWEVVVAQRAARRRGCASTKGRSDVDGSTRKVYKQKGTGRARHGSIRAPIYVGGGRAHGPKPRSYAAKVSKKVRRAALISALSLRQQQTKLLVMDKLALGEIKTKRLAEMLARIGVDKGLIVDGKNNAVLIKSARNLANAKYLAPEGLNVVDVLKFDTLLVTADAVREIEERLAS